MPSEHLLSWTGHIASAGLCSWPFPLAVHHSIAGFKPGSYMAGGLCYLYLTVCFFNVAHDKAVERKCS